MIDTKDTAASPSRAEPVAWGFAVSVFGEIDVCTVSPTWRAAAINWLVVNAGQMIYDHTSDKCIEQLWDMHQPLGGQIVSVNIADSALSASPLSSRAEVVREALMAARERLVATSVVEANRLVVEQIDAAIRALAQPAVGRDGTIAASFPSHLTTGDRSDGARGGCIHCLDTGHPQCRCQQGGSR